MSHTNHVVGPLFTLGNSRHVAQRLGLYVSEGPAVAVEDSVVARLSLQAFVGDIDKGRVELYCAHAPALVDLVPEDA